MIKQFFQRIMASIDGGYKKIDAIVTTAEVDPDTATTNSSVLLHHYSDLESNPFGDAEESPQGRHLGIFSTMVLYISRILGSGIFATSSVIFESCGRSPLWFSIAWAVSFVMAYAGLYIYLELGSLIPRNGGTKAFLEVIYDKPYMMISVVFSMYSVAFGIAISSPLVFGEYFLETFDIEVTAIKSRFVAIVFILITGGFHAFSVKHGVMVQNFLGVMKIGLLILLFLTGIWVIGFPTEVTGVHNHLTKERFFQSEKPVTFSSFSNAVVVASFVLAGWNMGHTSSSEVKDPVRTYRIAGPSALFLIFIGYTAINVCYLTVLTTDELAEGGNLIGSLLFERVYGSHFGKRFLNFCVAFSTAGNIFVVIYSVSRMSQEVFKEGYLPFSRFMAANNKRFGTPVNAICLCLTMSTIILAFCRSDGTYGYIVSLEGYPVSIYTLGVAIGLLIVRRRYAETRAPIRASIVGTTLVIIGMLFVVLAPFVSGKNPNPKGTEHWIPYPLLAGLLICGFVIYWFMMFVALPYWGNYDLVPEVDQLEDGLRVKTWTRVARF